MRKELLIHFLIKETLLLIQMRQNLVYIHKKMRAILYRMQGSFIKIFLRKFIRSILRCIHQE